MKIAASLVSMQSEHFAARRRETRESLRTWVGPERPDFEGRQRPTPRVEISAAGRAAQSRESQAIEAAADAVEQDPVLSLIKSMVELLTGRRVKVFDAAELASRPSTPEVRTPPQEAASTDAAPSAGFGIEYEFHSVVEEVEQTNFSAQGVVRTQDGREIAFTADLAMSRQYRETVDISFRAGDAQRKDPLVLNFNGTAAQLTDRRFAFDLDTDGATEDIATLAAGSGYLALDLDGNGSIDSGAELFGPSTGSGFGELAGYDEDDNGWIDENDAVFDRLRVWSPGEDAGAALTTLRERQVGALYLGHVATPFELRGEGNADLGAVSASGLYLRESGEAGTLQEIDLSV